MDSLNALILLYKEHAELLAGRAITIHVLDLDRAGPSFGARALAALLAPNAPLRGLAVEFKSIEYNWADATGLRRLIDEMGADEPVVAGSSEGGLFEFASDAEIVANLPRLAAGTPRDMVMVGSSRAQCDDPRTRASDDRACSRQTGGPFPRPGKIWRAGARRRRRTIDRSLDGPMHQVVRLGKI